MLRGDRLSQHSIIYAWTSAGIVFESAFEPVESQDSSLSSDARSSSSAVSPKGGSDEPNEPSTLSKLRDSWPSDKLDSCGLPSFW